jgi:nucleolar GTP-binding protein
MNFQGLAKIEKHEWYLDLAFRTAKKDADEAKASMRAKPDSIKRAELAKITSIRRTLTRHLDIILKSFPSIDGLTEFYRELIRAMLDYAELKKSLGGLNWAKRKIDFFSEMYRSKMQKCEEFKRMTAHSREYYGRISSVMKQIRKQLDYLEQCRRVMKGFPSIKSGMFTVCIAGFPNVGKTTLLSKLTGSTPEIANYAFTTKTLNMGYAAIDNKKVQFIDTPGTLNRFEKMNPIEKQAYLAIKYCADMVVFVFDPSDQAYEPDIQIKLLNHVADMGKEVVVYVSKTDIQNSGKVFPLRAGTAFFKDAAELKKHISSSVSCL